MKYAYLMTTLAALTLCNISTVSGQEGGLPKPGPEIDVLKSDVGTWEVEIKTWTGPGEPMETKGRETNRMLGGFWLVSDFQGNMMGLDFKGLGTYSYDIRKKQYVGTWIDSLSPNQMDLTGRYDKDKQTMTFEGMAAGPDGNLAKHVLTTQFKNDGTRVMVMRMQVGDAMIKVFEMNYKKAKSED